jgi:hypothetical protein
MIGCKKYFRLTTPEQVDVLKKALENIFIPFDKESDKIKFIKDICNEYENQLTDFLTKRDN